MVGITIIQSLLNKCGTQNAYGDGPWEGGGRGGRHGDGPGVPVRGGEVRPGLAVERGGILHDNARGALLLTLERWDG